MKGAVSTGHPLTTQAALRMLKKGGNAFDALVSAGFASTVTESIFASLGGGCFILGHHFEDQKDFFYDCFVNTPGLGKVNPSAPQLIPMELHFSRTTQVFHVGMASIAVPGMLKGLIHCYQENCSMDLDDLIQPAIEYLAQGIELTPSQEYILRVVKPIFDLSDYGREIYRYDSNKKLYNPLYQEFLKLRSIERWLEICFTGKQTETFIKDMEHGGGFVTKEDLNSYQVIERTPYVVNYRNCQVVSNPPPSFGGPIICRALSILQELPMHDKDPVQKALIRAEILKQINHFKGAGGTTHMNVIDSQNNAACLSASAGTGCGYFYPETGILMNNMMGEEDLHPGEFYCGKAGTRVSSMMAPTFIKKEGKVIASLGTGGSNRIRSSILQVVMNLIDEGMTIEEAVEYPRMHFDEKDCLQVEKGLPENVMRLILERYPEANIWPNKDLYFGGVHSVMANLDGWGDSRRNGCYEKLDIVS